jgi:hypothetical protein
MKCIKNKKTGDIIRVEDKTADQMVGLTWQFVSKDEWRKHHGIVKEEVVTISHDMGGPIQVKINKRKKKSTNEIEDFYDLGGSE